MFMRTIKRLFVLHLYTDAWPGALGMATEIASPESPSMLALAGSCDKLQSSCRVGSCGSGPIKRFLVLGTIEPLFHGFAVGPFTEHLLL